MFVTLTAPSFGSVHARREKGRRVLACRPRRKSKTCPHGIRLSCLEKHAGEDDRLGEPVCPDCYDYAGAVLFNACAPELWRRFTITLRRTLARQAGLAAQVRVSYAKVAEYQRRGVVHFHAIVRIDGPAGPADPPPAWVTIALLTAAIDQAARAVSLTTPAAPGLPARALTWGRQLDATDQQFALIPGASADRYPNATSTLRCCAIIRRSTTLTCASTLAVHDQTSSMLAHAAVSLLFVSTKQAAGHGRLQLHASNSSYERNSVTHRDFPRLDAAHTAKPTRN